MIKRTILITRKAEIKVRYGQLLIKMDNETKQVPIEDLGFIVIENRQTYISIPAITALNDENVAVIFCDERHLPVSMMLNLDAHHLQQQIFKAQIQASEPLKKNLWKQTVKQKILNQAYLLENQGITWHPLRGFAAKVTSGDTTNREGAAAQYYWKHIFGKPFYRDRNGEYPNVFLNYGYTIIRAAVARALAGSGLLNTLGIHHRNKYNAFALADDIMEPFRPMVDERVIAIMNKYPHERILTKEIKAELLSLLTRTVYDKKGQKSPFMVALQRTTSSLQQCFTGQRRTIEFPQLWN